MTARTPGYLRPGFCESGRHESVRHTPDMDYALAQRLRLPQVPVDLTLLPTGAKYGFEGGKRAGKRALAAMGEELDDLQERMYADAYTGGPRRVLLVLQGMDTAGKGGVIDHALGMLNPHGFKLTSFKEPTEEERAHDFLWRIDRAVPPPGTIGVFDRSHYEDVVVARVRHLADEAEIERRYEAINDWERRLVYLRLGTREIEEALLSHQGVAECAVVGVADALKGQAALAFVVPRDPDAVASQAGRLAPDTQAATLTLLTTGDPRQLQAAAARWLASSPDAARAIALPLS